MKFLKWDLIKIGLHAETLFELSGSMKKVESLEIQLEKCNSKVKTEHDIELLISQRIDQVKQLDRKKKEFDKQEADLENTKGEVIVKKEQVSNLNHEIHKLGLQNQAKEEDLKDLDDKIGDIEVRRQELSNNEAQLESDIKKYESGKKKNEEKQEELRKNMAEIVRQSSSISNMEDLEDELISLEKETSNLAKETTKNQALLKELETRRGEYGIVSALEFEIEKGEVSENWIKLFSVILDSKMNAERKDRIMMHLSARLEDEGSYKVNMDDADCSDPAEKLLLLIQKYKNENAGEKVTPSEISDVLEKLSGKIEFRLGQEAALL